MSSFFTSRSFFAAIAAATLFCCTRGEAGLNEVGNLEADIVAGVLEIDAASVSAVETPISGPVTATGSEQVDAVVFRVEDLRILDLNGDGSGFLVIAVPGKLTNPASGPLAQRTLSIGTLTGFADPSEPANCTLANHGVVPFLYSSLSYGSGAGCDLTVDYEIAYTVPAFAMAGDYTGTISFSVYAE